MGKFEYAIAIASTTYGGQPKPHLTAQGWTVLIVDYSREADLVYHLGGVDLVISMVSGYDQLLFIDAALQAGVRRFAPAEFSGLPNKRPPALDQKHNMALSRLRGHVEEGMAFTTISCGLLYERFGPGGLQGVNMGSVAGNNAEGDFLMNVRTMRAQVPYDASGAPAKVCMTSMQDVAQFIVAALDLPYWPSGLRMRGERMNVSDLVKVAERFRGMCLPSLEIRAPAADSLTQTEYSNGPSTMLNRCSIRSSLPSCPVTLASSAGFKPYWPLAREPSTLQTPTLTTWSTSYPSLLNNGLEWLGTDIFDL